MCIGIFSFRAFDRRLARLAAPISSGVRQGGQNLPPPSGARSAEYPSGARVKSSRLPPLPRGGSAADTCNSYSRHIMYLPCFWFLNGHYEDSWTNFVRKVTNKIDRALQLIRHLLDTIFGQLSFCHPSKNQKQGRYILYHLYMVANDHQARVNVGGTEYRGSAIGRIKRDLCVR